MAVEPTSVRTVAIIGQGGVGKTSVADALAFAAGANNRLGRVDDETSLFDTEAEEMRRRCSITTSIFSFPWAKHDVTVVDTPGQGNFVLDTKSSLSGVAGVVFVVDPTSPLRAESGKVWSWAEEAGLPVLIFVNRMDRDEASLDTILSAVKEQLGGKPALIQQPIGEGASMSGLVDLVSGKAHAYSDESGKFESGDVPADLADTVAALKSELTENAAEGNDELLEKYLDAGELSDQEIRAGLKEGVRTRGVMPVLCGSAARNVGFRELLDAIVELLPAPCEAGAAKATDSDGNDLELEPDAGAPFAGLVVKTLIDPHAGQLSIFRVMSGTASADSQVINVTNGAKERIGALLTLQGAKTTKSDSAVVGQLVAVAKLKGTHRGNTLADSSRQVTVAPAEAVNPVISFALEAKKRGEEDKAMQGLARLVEEDPALSVERDEDTGEILLSGAGQLHVEVACERLQRKYGVEVVLKAPKVPYRETIRKATKAHGRLKKQTGGHGQFADCRIEVEPQPRGVGFEFVNKIVGGAIPRGFIPAVEKGIVEAMKKGLVAGYPVVDVKVTLVDGQYHDVDSSEMAFKVAGSMAFKDALESASPILLEPYVNLEVTSPDECMGDVMGDLNSRRGKVEGMEQRGHSEVIKAKVPMSEVLRYAPDLTSMTSGRGSFEMSFSHYDPLPDHLAAKVAQETAQAKED